MRLKTKKKKRAALGAGLLVASFSSQSVCRTFSPTCQKHDGELVELEGEERRGAMLEKSFLQTENMEQSGSELQKS